MEDLLLNIVKEATGPKLLTLKQSAQEAHDLLNSQCSGLLRTPAHELRSACFKPLRMALETKRTKLVSLSLSGLHKVVRDERFQAGNEPEDDSLWLPAQLLHATGSMLTQCEDTQVQVLRVFLGLACGAGWALNGRLVMLVLGRCGEAYEAGTQPVRAAAQAAASQTVTAFCTFLDEECEDILQQQHKLRTSGSSSTLLVYSQTSAVACFNEAIPVMQYMCSRLEEARTCPKVHDTTVFLLECLLTLVSTLPRTVHSNTHFTTFLWQRFCPALLALLGTPGDPTSQGLTTGQAKIVYSIGIQLVRLVGSEPALRPVLEALFHRMLLLPGPVRRLEPLRAVRELLRSPGRLADLLLLRTPPAGQRHTGDDMAIIRLIMDSIEESAQCQEPAVMLASVECVVALLTSLDALCRGEGVTQEAAAVANARYHTLDQADYKGPLTYQSLARLPKPYRDVVANLRYHSDSDSSGIGRATDPHTDTDDSDTSGPTEGPEDRATDSEDSILDDDMASPSAINNTTSTTTNNNNSVTKLPKGLQLGRAAIDECNVDIERHNARHFVKTLQNILLPNLLSLRSSIQVDEILQEFASKCCQHNSAQSFDIKTIMNADGIYLATYSALLLNLRLIQLGHYNKNGASAVKIPLSEAQFVEEVYGSGVLVYLSATWLSELYQQVLANSLLEAAGYEPNSGHQYALINLLTDVGGLGPSHLLTDWQRLERVHCAPPEPSAELEAGLKLSRRVLTCCWDSMVTVLSGAIDEAPTPAAAEHAGALGRLLPRRAKRLQGRRRARDHLLSASLDGLHKAASLSNTLRMQRRASSILALLAAAACRPQAAGTRLHAAHALSLDVLLAKGLALGSHSAACWPHVFSACVHVAKLEHALFSKAGAAHMLLVAQNRDSSVVTSAAATDKLAATLTGTNNSNNNNSNSSTCSVSSSPGSLSGTSPTSFRLNAAGHDEETCVDVYSFLQSSVATPLLGGNGSGAHGETSVADVVNKSGAHNTQHGLLSNVDAAKVCCLLSQQVDSLFHEAALKLSLPCLCAFLQELCASSHRQLFAREESTNSGRAAVPARRKWWRRTLDPEQRPVATLLLQRVGDVTLKCIRAGRPLVHAMRVWSVVGPHLLRAACHKERAVSKRAIACMHDAVTALLNEQLELPHFHLNEALLKPFENLLCLELADLDVQDQIVACLCEFVEANRTEICSGWRPLFGTLRVANTSPQNAAAIADVFKIFLSTDNTLVFANAALDYILCLLTHIRGTDIHDDTDDSDTNVMKHSTVGGGVAAGVGTTAGGTALGFSLDTSANKFESNEPVTIDLCRESLKYLESCVNILEMMYNMPKCPTFNMQHRVHIDMEPQLVDGTMPGLDDVTAAAVGVGACDALDTRPDMEQCERQHLTLSRLDKPSGVLKIWYILIEGLASSSMVCARSNQAMVLETLFKILRELLVCPGHNFGLYCINHLLLPMVQNWLRQQAKMQRAWDTTTVTTLTTNNSLGAAASAANFKQCCGMATELVVEYIEHIQGARTTNASTTIDKSYYTDPDTGTKHVETETQPESVNPALMLALKQLLLILVECVTQPNEQVARLGTSCIRHIVSSAGQSLGAAQWDVVVAAVQRACALSLQPLRQLALAFRPNSDSFYGDVATVKVAARKDCTPDECAKLYQLARQVFAQRECVRCGACACACTATDDRSYVFLLYPGEAGGTLLNPDLYTVRVPLRALVVGLLAHQMLTQTVASALLQNLHHITPIFNILQVHNYSLRGILTRVTARHVHALLHCLQLSSVRAKEFDARPGLKFLMQKVANLARAANLYAQANTSDVVQIIVLIELCLDGFERFQLSEEQVRADLADRAGPPPTSDRDYVRYFLVRLKQLWDGLIHTYMGLSLHMDATNFTNDTKESTSPSLSLQQVTNSTTSNIINNNNITNTTSKSTTDAPHKPFKFADFINDPVSCGMDDEDDDDDDNDDDDVDDDDDDEDGGGGSGGSSGRVGRTNDDDEDDVDVDEEEHELDDDDDGDDMVKMRKSGNRSDGNGVHELDKETELKVEAMMEQYRKRKPYHVQAARVTEAAALPPAQPVPAEIQQQRQLSIRKDHDCYKSTYVETVEACLELLGSLPADRIRPLALVLEHGVCLLTTAPDHKIAHAAHTLQRCLQPPTPITSSPTVPPNPSSLY